MSATCPASTSTACRRSACGRSLHRYAEGIIPFAGIIPSFFWPADTTPHLVLPCAGRGAKNKGTELSFGPFGSGRRIDFASLVFGLSSFGKARTGPALRSLLRPSEPTVLVLPCAGRGAKKQGTELSFGPFGSGRRTRTSDLRVMSPTSCQLLYPALYRKMNLSFRHCKGNTKNGLCKIKFPSYGRCSA